MASRDQGQAQGYGQRYGQEPQSAEDGYGRNISTMASTTLNSNGVPERFALPTRYQRLRAFVLGNLNFYRVHLLAFTIVSVWVPVLLVMYHWCNDIM